MSLKQMSVTDAGILNINRKIIDSRRYEKSLITTVGDVSVTNGKASRFDENSYLYQVIALSNKSISITCSGTLITSGDDQVAFSLSGDSGELLELHFNNSQMILVINSKIVLQFSSLVLYQGIEFNTIIDISENLCRATLVIEDAVFEKTVNLSQPLNPSTFNKIYIGGDGQGGSNFWYGSINLTNFTISQDGKLIYTPSTSYPLEFTKVLVSDEEFPLTDNSIPILNHVVECPIEEISRSGSSLLLKSEVDKDASLTIKEIGLYANVDGEEILFGILKGISVNKSYDASYELIIAMNLYISFVHVVGFPNKGSFKVVEPKYALLKDFQIVRDLNLYLYTNYERMVRNNAMELGYNTAETFFELQKSIGYYEDCYASTQSCLKIMQKLDKYKEYDEETGEEIVESRKALKQFYVLPDYRKIRYATKDLCNLDDYDITFTYKSFKGNRDLIVFSDEKDNSLCIKANLKDSKSKLILAKTNLINEPYFTLLFADQNIHLILNNVEKTIVLSKEISDKELPFFTGAPILLSLIKKGNNFALYRNEELVVEFSGMFGTPHEYVSYFLCNYIQQSELLKIQEELSIPRYAINEIQENYDKYVDNVIFMDGALNSEDLKYVNLLMGTRD